ncbi:MAG: hypothetical protein AABX51_03060 [Nanoarchaeota archaeon]
MIISAELIEGLIVSIDDKIDYDSAKRSTLRIFGLAALTGFLYSCGIRDSPQKEGITPTATFKPVYTKSPTSSPSPSQSPTASPIPALSPSPTVVPTPIPTIEPTPAPSPTPVTLTECIDGSQLGGELYISPIEGVRRRLQPVVSAPYNGVVPMNTHLSLECQQDVSGQLWLRVNDGTQFWIPQEWTSQQPIITPTPVPTPPTVINPGGGNKIILTFDDYGEYSSNILDILASYSAKGL